MRYRILLTGKNNVIKDDFFGHLEKDFELQTVSLCFGDIVSHLRYFKPHALVVCMRNESKDDLGVFSAVKSRLENYNVPTILIGSEEECGEFEANTGKMSALVITRPVSLRYIRDTIFEFVENWQKENGEEAALDEVEIKPVDEIVQAEPEGQTEPAEQTEQKPEEKKNILVVDDDPMMLKLIKEQLKDTYSVATAINSNIAFKFLEKKKTDLILLDYEMPGENGAQVLEKVRNNEATAQLPVIFLTGINDKDKIRKVLELKPQGYLLKPIDRNKLLDIIQKNIV